MSLAPGTRIGVFEVQSALGAGGMGEVYLARDTRLKRNVALKVLPDTFAQDDDRVARFRREAELLASLNHPNIAQIYGLEGQEAQEGQDRRALALVMELVEGPTLADLIDRGSIALDEALPIARQIADALEAAHEKGVIHRDLKPANVKVTPDGTVKVLDFGLAKLAPLEGGDAAKTGGVAALSMSPTLSVHATYAGVILGTAAYMSPEQAKGRTVDKRSDVWAWGCVLFEMLTGRRPFEGEDVADTIAFVLTKDPDWALLPPAVPPAVRVLLHRCMEKDRKKRIADISTARFVLDEAAALRAPEPAAAVSPAPSTSWWRRLAAYAAVLVAAVVVTAAAAWALLKGNDPTPQPARFAIVPPSAQPLNVNSPDRGIAISPDGAHIVYRGGNGSAGVGSLTLRAIDRLEAHALPGIQAFRHAFFSPDGKWIGYFSLGELRKVSVSGGPSLQIVRTTSVPRGASWGPDDTIILATADSATGLLRVPAGGGEMKVLTRPDAAHGESDHVFPSILPDGSAVLFTITASGQPDNSQVAVLDLKSGTSKILVRGGSQAEFVEPDHLVYAASGSLRAVRFDVKALELTSDPVPVVEQILTAATGEAAFAVSRTGSLVYVPGGTGGLQASARSLVWVDRRGNEEPIKAPQRAYQYPRMSPDGTRVALDVRDQDNDIWIWDLARTTLTRLTTDAALEGYPVWTPDGRRVVFNSQRSGLNANLYWQAADGTGAAERLTTSGNIQLPTTITLDGAMVVLEEQVPGSLYDIMGLTLMGGRRTQPLIHTAFSERNAEISPDGRWIAYQQFESTQSQVYVRPFPNVDSGRWQISSAGGTRPLWARSGRELFYLDAQDKLTGVPVQTTASTFSAGNPTKLLETAYFAGAPTGRTYDVSPDGKRFLMIKESVETNPNAAPAGLVVVLHWNEELKRLLPRK
jgi:serine/threonine-protein kinase